MKQERVKKNVYIKIIYKESLLVPVKPPILSGIQILQDKSDQEKRCDGYQTLR